MLFITLFLSGTVVARQDTSSSDPERLQAQAEAVLADLHDSAARADATRHLACFAEDAVILGTAPEERFPMDHYRDLVRLSFAAGSGWTSIPFQQDVRVAGDGSIAWFDERLRRADDTELRTSGVLRRAGDRWQIVQLNNVFPVPNERARELAEKIRERVAAPDPSIPGDSPAVDALVAFHRAGREADIDAYIGWLAEDAIVLGTDASERNPPAALHDMLEPWFSAGKGLDTDPVVVHVSESADGRFAWFDGRFHKPSLCELRGSGLLRHGPDGWKIVHYNVAFALPNDLIDFLSSGRSFTTPLAVEALLQDFDLLRGTLEEWHPALYSYESREEVDALFELTRRSIREPMTALRFETLLAPLVARAHCVHTRIDRNAAHAQARRIASTYLPVEPHLLDGRLYVRRNYATDPRSPAARLVPGTELLAINGLSARQVIARLFAVIPSDAGIRSQKKAILNDHFNQLYATHLGSPERFELTLAADGPDDPDTVAVAALTSTEWSLAVAKKGPSPSPGPTRALETRIDADQDVAVLAVHSFSPVTPARFRVQLGEFFEQLESEKIANLVVDLRHNPGGSPELGSLLVSHLVDRPFTYLRTQRGQNTALQLLGMRTYMRPRPPAEHAFEGRIFALIGGRNTSTSGHVLSLLKQQGRVVLIGQEAGATWICNDNSKTLSLPGSGIDVRIARTTFSAAVTGMPADEGVLPDHLVRPTVADMVAGTDLEMDLALRLIRKQG